jgi:beta-N-acetylhexosaminidase
MAKAARPARARVLIVGVVALVLSACGSTRARDVAPLSATVKPAVASTSSAHPTSRGQVHQTRPTRFAAPVPARLDPARLNPQNWSSQQLAAELVMTGATMGHAAAIEHAASIGVAGIVLFGPSSPSLAQTLSVARATAPSENSPLIASDEEGGEVQRLSALIYPLPSAEAMGNWSSAKITATARDYGLRMRAIGVTVALSPDADVAAAGYFIAATHRSFSTDPTQVASDVNAWNDGLDAAGVLGVVKHWPGHGHATDSQVGTTITPPWSELERHDLIPFKAAFADHARAVIIGHLRVQGLTEGSLPASESPTALRTLRGQAGANVLIVTDDLSMAAASTALGISPSQAAVRSLAAGADVAMVCWAPVDTVISEVARAIDDGQLPRAAAVASARRVLLIKSQVALHG